MADRTCSDVDCDRAVLSRGMCAKHYNRWRANRPDAPRCSVGDCSRASVARGWCNAHYMRWKTTGDVGEGKPFIDMRPGSAIERIMRRVEKTRNGCWVYRGALMNTGYGSVRADGKDALTHRLTYEHFIGPIPEGLHIDHLCRNRACCNPEHLEPVTQAENNRRAWEYRSAWIKEA